ncbi:MAG TPA: hypothetical protein VLH75_14055 [Longimicrobiales bacterium]|nr:hypothetical protein [Longimicrobiales bacterium]
MKLGAFYRQYLLPGLVFQSVVIGGGYGTGRELVEFFLRYGPTAGLVAMACVAMVIWSAVAAVSFAFAHVTRSYDYRSFIRQLLGRGWILYEACYLILLLLVLAVTGAAAGQILLETVGVPYYVGVLTIAVAVSLVVLGGSALVEPVFAVWSFVLYAAYIVLIVVAFVRFGDDIVTSVSAGEFREGWLLAGMRYAGYNLCIIPAILFVCRHVESARGGLLAGLIAGVIGMVPAILLYLAMAGLYPGIVDQPVPVNHLLAALGSPWFQVVFQVVLFGTLVETGSGMIHAVNERIAGAFEERKRAMPRLLRPAAALLFVAAGVALSSFGLVDLVAKGYGTVTWGFLLVYVLPILTIGVWHVAKAWPRGGASVRS